MSDLTAMANGVSSAEQGEFRQPEPDISRSKPSSGRFRQFAAIGRMPDDYKDDWDIYAGHGMTLDEAVAKHVAFLDRCSREEVPMFYPTVDDKLATMGDSVVWGPEPDRIGAIILARPGGIQVVRVDKEIPENPEVGPTNFEARETPRPEREIDSLTPQEKDLLASARKVGYEEASCVLSLASAFNKPIVPGSRDQPTSEAVGRLLLLPEDRFIWRRAAGYTSTDDEARAEMDRFRVENPGYRVAEVLTNLEQEMLEKLRKLGLKESDSIIGAVLGLDLTVSEALARLADDGDCEDDAECSPGLVLPAPQLPDWASDPNTLAVALSTMRGAIRNHLEVTEIIKVVEADPKNQHLNVIGTQAADRFNKSCTATLRAILAWHGQDDDQPELFPAPNCAIKFEGNLFVAVHFTEEDLRECEEIRAEKGDPQMALAVLPLAKIIDLDAIEARPIPEPTVVIAPEVVRVDGSTDDPEPSDVFTVDDAINSQFRSTKRTNRGQPEPFLTYRADDMRSFSRSRSMTLDQFIADEVADLEEYDEDADVAIWLGGFIVATIRIRDGKAPEIIKFQDEVDGATPEGDGNVEVAESSPPLRGHGVAEESRRSPLPLLRSFLTVTLPSDTGFGPPTPVSIEVVVLASDVHESDVTATVDDLPELKSAGWRGYSACGLKVFTRTVAG